MLSLPAPSVSLDPVSASFGSSFVLENLRMGEATSFLHLRLDHGRRSALAALGTAAESSERAGTRIRSQRRTKGEKEGLVRGKRRGCERRSELRVLPSFRM